MWFKAGYQINQMVVAAAIWLSFSDLFFFILAEVMLIFPQLSCLKHRGQQGRWEYCYSWVGFIQISCGILVQVRIRSRAAGVWLLAETKTRLGHLHGKSSAASYWQGQGQGQLWVCIMTSMEIFWPPLPLFAHPPLLFSLLISTSLGWNSAPEASISADLWSLKEPQYILLIYHSFSSVENRC